MTFPSVSFARTAAARFIPGSLSPAPGENGLKHIACATIKERLAYKHAKRKTLVAYARATRDYNLALSRAIGGKWPEALVDLNGQRRLPV